MKLSTFRNVLSTPEDVWGLVEDVERWPEWTASMDRVERLSGEGLQVGATFKLKQPRTPALTWHVTEVESGRSFAWVARSPGSVVTAVHTVAPDASGCRVQLDLEQTGFLGAIFGRLMAGRYRRFMDMEADGLKARAEAGNS